MDIEVDYFIHTWDINTWKDPNNGYCIRTEQCNDLASLTELYNPKKIEIEHYNELRFLAPWFPLFYSNMKSLFLKREYEVENGFQYDIVIRARLDVIYNPITFMQYTRLLPLTCYTDFIAKFPEEYNNNNFDDIIFFGDSPTMDLVGDVYYALRHHLSEEVLGETNQECDINTIASIGPGCVIYRHICDLNIHPMVYNFTDHCIIREYMVKNNCLITEDYKELKKLHYTWYR